jgi:hypothetical protein
MGEQKALILHLLRERAGCWERLEELFERGLDDSLTARIARARIRIIDEDLRRLGFVRA